MKEFILQCGPVSYSITSNKDFKIRDYHKQFQLNYKKEKNINIKVIFNDKKEFALKKEGEIILFEIDPGENKRLNLVFSKTFQVSLEFAMLSQSFMIHAMAIKINDKAIVCAAEGVSGKSTVARALNDGQNILHEDCVYIHKIKDEWWVSPSLKFSNRYFCNNHFLQLDKVFVLKPSEKNEISNYNGDIERLIYELNNNTIRYEEKKPLIHEFLVENEIKTLEHNVFAEEKLEELKKILE